MPRIIVRDAFPLSRVARRAPDAGVPPTALDLCRSWIMRCIQAGNRVCVPATARYEVVRELERRGADAQISRPEAFCRAKPDRFLSIEDADLRLAATLWARARNAGTPTAAPESLDGDVILAAQVPRSGASTANLVLATTNVGHLSRFVPAEL